MSEPLDQLPGGPEAVPAAPPAKHGWLNFAIDFGPLLVGMDSHGGSLFADVQREFGRLEVLVTAASYFRPKRLESVTADELRRIEEIANAETLANAPARVFETTKDEAEKLGAIAFFGDKYGDIVRVLEAGTNSMELCGGTHVRATGDIGTIKIVSEGSIASGVRRVEAVTGANSIALVQRESRMLSDASRLVGSKSDELVSGIQRKLDEIKLLQDEVKTLRARAALGRASELAAAAANGSVVARVDGLLRHRVDHELLQAIAGLAVERIERDAVGRRTRVEQRHRAGHQRQLQITLPKNLPCHVRDPR